MAASPAHQAPQVALRPQFDWDTAAAGAQLRTLVLGTHSEALSLDDATVASTAGRGYLAIVCTGHGPHGQAAAVAAVKHLSQTMLGHEDGGMCPQLDALDDVACKDAFLRCNKDLCTSASLDASHSGASALVLAVCDESTPGAGDACIVASSAGNCRAVLARAHSSCPGPGPHQTSGADPSSSAANAAAAAPALEAVQLSSDALLACPSERCRLEASGTRVESYEAQQSAASWAPSAGAATHRLVCADGGGAIKVPASRVLGFTAAQPAGVTAEPLVLRWRRCGLDHFVVVGSEGLWRAFTSEEAVCFVQRYCEAPAAATAAAASAAAAAGGTAAGATAAGAAAATAAAAGSGGSMAVADALVWEAQERLKLRLGKGCVCDVTAIVVPLAAEYFPHACAPAAAAASGNSKALAEPANGGALPIAARSNAGAAMLARRWAAEPWACPASTPAATPFPWLLPALRLHPWHAAAANAAAGVSLHRLPPARRSSLGTGFVLTQRHSSELELSGYRDSHSSGSNASACTCEEQAMVVHKVRLSGDDGTPPEMESMLFGSATSGRPDTTVARHLGLPPSPLHRSHSVNVASLALARARSSASSSSGGASPAVATPSYGLRSARSLGHGRGSGQGLRPAAAASAPTETQVLRKARSYQALHALQAPAAAGIAPPAAATSAPAVSRPLSLASATASGATAAHAVATSSASAAESPVQAGLLGLGASSAVPQWRSPFAVAGPSTARGSSSSSSSSGGMSSSSSGVISSSSGGISSGPAAAAAALLSAAGSSSGFPGLLEADSAAVAAAAAGAHQQAASAYVRLKASMRQLLLSPKGSGSVLRSAPSAGQRPLVPVGSGGNLSHAPPWQPQQQEGWQGLQLLLPQHRAPEGGQGSWASSGALQGTDGLGVLEAEQLLGSPLGSTSSAGASDRVAALAEGLTGLDDRKMWRHRPEPRVHGGLRKGSIPRACSMPSLVPQFSLDPPDPLAAGARVASSSSPVAAAAGPDVAHSLGDDANRSRQRLIMDQGAAVSTAWVRPPPLLVVAASAPTDPSSPLSMGPPSGPNQLERTQSAKARRALAHGLPFGSSCDSLTGSGSLPGELQLQHALAPAHVSGHSDAGGAGRGAGGAAAVHDGTFAGGTAALHDAGLARGVALSTQRELQQVQAYLGAFAPYAGAPVLGVGSPEEEHKVHGGRPLGSVPSSPVSASQPQHLKPPRPGPPRNFSFPPLPGTSLNRLRTTATQGATAAAAAAAAAAARVPASSGAEHPPGWGRPVANVRSPLQPHQPLQPCSPPTEQASLPLEFEALADAAADALARSKSPALDQALMGAKGTMSASAAVPSAAAPRSPTLGSTQSPSSTAHGFGSSALSLGSRRAQFPAAAGVVSLPPSTTSSSSSSGGGGGKQGPSQHLPLLLHAMAPPPETEEATLPAALTTASPSEPPAAAVQSGAAAKAAAVQLAAAVKLAPAPAAGPMPVPVPTLSTLLHGGQHSPASMPLPLLHRPQHVCQLPVLQESSSSDDGGGTDDGSSTDDGNGSGGSSRHGGPHSSAHQRGLLQQAAEKGSEPMPTAAQSALPQHVLGDLRVASDTSVASFEATLACNVTGSVTSISDGRPSTSMLAAAEDDDGNDCTIAPTPFRTSFEFGRHMPAAGVTPYPTQLFGQLPPQLAGQRLASSWEPPASIRQHAPTNTSPTSPAKLGKHAPEGVSHTIRPIPLEVHGQAPARSSVFGPRSSGHVLLAAAAAAVADAGEIGAQPPLQLLRHDSASSSSGEVHGAWECGEGRVHRGGSLRSLLRQGLLTGLDVVGECGEAGCAAGSSITQAAVH